MRGLMLVSAPCLFGLAGLANGPLPPVEEALAHAQERFQLGVARLRQPAEARRLFVEAADEFERLRGRVHSPAYYLAMGNTEALAGRWPRAICAYHTGLKIDPNDAALRAHLQYAQSLVNYPPGERGRPAPDVWPGWLHRPTANDLCVLAAAGYSLAWLAAGWWYVRRGALAMFCALGFFAAALASGAIYHLDERQAQDEYRHPLLVVLVDGTPLHRGNGPSYPLHADVPSLPAGMEARLLHARGTWLQVQLATGEIGWVASEAVMAVARR